MDRSSVSRGPAMVLVNGKSGTVRSMGVETVNTLIGAALRDWPAGSEVHVIDGSEIEEAVNRVVVEGKYKTLIVGGGDGTGNGVTPIIFADGHAKLLSANSLNTFGKVIWRFR